MDKKNNNRISFNVLTKNDLKGTWFIEIQPIKSTDLWKNKHWAPESIYVLPEQLELFTKEIHRAKKDYSFFNDNRISIHEEIIFVKELSNTVNLIKSLNNNDFFQWITNHKYSKNIMESINIKTKPFMQNLQNSIINFAERIIIYIEERITKKEDIMIIGI